ncbi:MAG: DEAD/DEAH box helicase [Proteobacteria bacterium]|nr:DEAD/DEAH box helicase [Pseudomonadota bacterium]
MTMFSELGLIEPLLRALASEGYTAPTPIQVRAIPPLLRGRDLLGVAQTGTGKTAAFALPILQRLAEARRRPGPRAALVLVLTPTRELAIQIGDSFAAYGRHLGLKRAVVYGGVGQNPQVAALAGGSDVLVATPGRLLDLIHQRHVRLDGVQTFVLDEADRMLDMGFIRDVRAIIAELPVRRQTLLFSATMPAAVAGLAESILRDFERVEVTPSATTVERVEQRVLFVERGDKRMLLTELLKDRAVGRAIVFTRTKHGANRVAEHLEKRGVSVGAIHGNKSQSARQQALAGFRAGRVRTLVATDIAARGIDIEGITHIINFDLPNEPESYVHRIGRTARAGADGVALSMCDADEVVHLRAIEKTIRQAVPVDDAHPYHAAAIARLYSAPSAQRGPSAGPRRSPRAGGSGNGKVARHSRPGHGRRPAA